MENKVDLLDINQVVWRMVHREEVYKTEVLFALHYLEAHLADQLAKRLGSDAVTLLNRIREIDPVRLLRRQVLADQLLFDVGSYATALGIVDMAAFLPLYRSIEDELKVFIPTTIPYNWYLTAREEQHLSAVAG